MKALTKVIAGAAAAAAMTVTAVPAQAQSWDRDRDRGIDAGDIIAGVAILGGVAAVIAALDNDNDRYRGRYDSRYGYDYGRYGAQAAVNACARQAQRYGRNVQITDLDRTSRGLRVRGRVDQIEHRRGWNRGYSVDRERFTCYAANGRIYDFRI